MRKNGSREATYKETSRMREQTERILVRQTHNIDQLNMKKAIRKRQQITPEYKGDQQVSKIQHTQCKFAHLPAMTKILKYATDLHRRR